MWTVAAVRAYYYSGLGTPRQLLSGLLQKANADKNCHAWIHLATLAELEPYLQRLANCAVDSLPLWGVPFAVKDNIDVAGMPTTAACPDYSYLPTEHAEVVRQLIAAGAIPMGKTNMDQFATGLVGVRSPYGAVPNPLHPDYIAGGSSSGSAASLALGHCAFSLGTDTAGSGRVPAAFCNLVGVKPSLGLVSTAGVVPACKSLDCVSIFAHNIADAECVLRCVENVSPVSDASNTLLIPVAEQMQFFGDKFYQKPWDEYIHRMKGVPGVHLQTVDISPLLEAAKLLYQGPWIAERWAALGAFVSARGESCFAVTRAILEQGAKVTGAEVFVGFEKLAQFRAQADVIFAGRGILVLPTAGALFTLDEVQAEPVLRNQELGTYTNFMNLLDLCGLALPGGHTEQGLPFGVTLVGRKGEDHALMAMASRLQQETTILAVCGAHMRGLPLNHELLECGAKFVRCEQTTAQYRFYALNTKPRKPGLVPVNIGGCSVAVELWSVPLASYGHFVARIPWPLGIGRIRLQGGEFVQGFVCDPTAIEGAEDISSLGNWRTFLNAL